MNENDMKGVMPPGTVEELEASNYADGDFDVAVWQDELMQMKADDIEGETPAGEEWQK